MGCVEHNKTTKFLHLLGHATPKPVPCLVSDSRGKCTLVAALLISHHVGGILNLDEGSWRLNYIQWFASVMRDAVEAY